MLRREDILSLGYLKKTAFSGSCQGIRFRLKKEERDGDAFLEVYAWPEPFSFDKTDESLKVRHEFSFDEDGVRQAVDWLNEMHHLLTSR